MAQNLIDLLERLLGSNDVLSRLGALVGLSPENTKGVIGAAVPAILAALVGVAQRPEGRDRLAAAVQGQDTSMLDNLAGALSGGREQSLTDSGRSLLGSLLGGGGKVDGLAGAIGKACGINQGSAGSLLGALAPVVLGALGREQRAQGLDAQGLGRLLTSQKDSIVQALPAGLASALGPTGLLDGVADRVGQAASTAAGAARATAAPATRPAGVTATPAPQPGSSSLLRWIIGIAVLLALIWAAYHFLFRGEPVREATEGGAPAANLMVGDVNVGQQVTDVFNNATAALNGVTDAASAEAAVPKLNGINDSLTNLGGLVNQLPAEGKTALAALVSGQLPNLEALIAKVTALPGVGDIIKPITDTMLERLRALTA
jgi:hypothetical protein